MTGEPERGNGLPVGLERGNVLGLVPNVLAGLVTNHEVSNGIQYSYASVPSFFHGVNTPIRDYRWV